MKCRECGKEIKKSDKFCGNCGKKAPTKVDEVIKQISDNKIKIIVFISLVIILILSYLLLNYITSATYKAKKYFDAVTSNKVNDVYNEIALDDTSLMNVNLLDKKIKRYSDISNVKVEREEIKENEALITFSYMEDNRYKIASVYLVKKNGKWVVDSGVVANDVTIKLPSGSKITLDDIDLSDYLDQEKSSDEVDVYTIDYMPKGDYKAKITLKDGTVVEKDVKIEDNSTYKLGNIEISEDSSKTLNDKTTNLVNDVYTGLINGANEISYDKEILEYYKDLNYDYKNSNYRLKSFKINDLKELYVTDNNGKLEVAYQIEYEYTINYNDTDYTGISRDKIIIDFDYEYNLIKIRDLGLRFPIRK